MKKVTVTASLFMLIMLLPKLSYAVNIEAGDWLFGINGFLDGEYTWMDEQAMIQNDMPGKMEEMSTLDQSHMNLLFGAEKDNLRININFHSHNSFDHDHHGAKGEFRIEEAYVRRK